MADNLPLKLTLADSRWIQRQIDEGVDGVFEIASKWAADPPAKTEAERAPRYADTEVRAEIAMMLYRAACRFGLYHSGVEAMLIASLNRAEAILVRMRDGAGLISPIALEAAIEDVREAPAIALALVPQDVG